MPAEKIIHENRPSHKRLKNFGVQTLRVILIKFLQSVASFCNFLNLLSFRDIILMSVLKEKFHLKTK